MPELQADHDRWGEGTVMPVAVAKAKKKNLLADLEQKAEERFQYAQMILAENSSDVNTAVEKMVETLERMGDDYVKVDGNMVPADPAVVRRINYKLRTWIAVRLLVASAEWEVQISDFKLPKGKCARCGKKVKA